MNRLLVLATATLMCSGTLLMCSSADSPAGKPATVKQSAAPVVKKDAVAAKATVAKSADTLILTGRLVEIPGKFPPNDLYSYVYVLKYRVTKIEKGTYTPVEILVGVYNPLIARGQVKDKMAKLSLGDAPKFETGAKHRLTLIKPIDAVWSDAVEDEYFDSELDKYYAVKVDLVK